MRTLPVLLILEIALTAYTSSGKYWLWVRPPLYTLTKSIHPYSLNKGVRGPKKNSGAWKLANGDFPDSLMTVTWALFLISIWQIREYDCTCWGESPKLNIAKKRWGQWGLLPLPRWSNMAEALYWEHAICHVSVYLFIQCLTSRLTFALYGPLPTAWLSAVLMILLFLASLH